MTLCERDTKSCAYAHVKPRQVHVGRFILEGSSRKDTEVMDNELE